MRPAGRFFRNHGWFFMSGIVILEAGFATKILEIRSWQS